MSKRFPPQIGLEANTPLLYNPYQDEFLKARRLRLCLTCKKVGSVGSDGGFICQTCKVAQAHARRLYRWFGLFAGRRGGKSLVGAHGAREEMLRPNSLGWVCGPTYKILHDATMPTLLKLIPRSWCADWDQDNLELTLTNGAQVQFRSLDDPDRGHAGVGLHWCWLDEAAFIAELGWDYLRPALADYGGAAFFTSSVDGYDWTYDRIEKPALIEKKPGFWAAKWRTIDNPFIAMTNPQEVEEARASMPPHLFKQEYEGERQNFTGSVYGEFIDDAWLANDDAVKAYIPEWPSINPSRRIIVPLDSGSDHPFGAQAIVVTERGLVVVSEYLERSRSFSAHLTAIQGQFPSCLIPLWCANRNEAQLRTEFAAHGILVAPAENDQMAGIQRVLSWLYVKQLKIAYTCPRTFEQMKKYRYAKNVTSSGEKQKEKVYKKEDELPDCIRYALMTWPSLPVGDKPIHGRDMSKLDPRTQWELAKLKQHESRDEQRDLQPAAKDYPLGDFYGNTESAENFFDTFY